MKPETYEVVKTVLVPVPNENAVWPGTNLFSPNMRPCFPTFAAVVERAGEGVGA